MKRVTMVVLSQYPGDPRVRREAESLARHGIAVDVVCYRNPGQERREEYGLVTAHRVMQVRDKTSILRYLLFSHGFAWRAFWEVESLARRTRPDLVQVHNMPDHLVFTALLRRMAGTPVVLDLHDLMVELFESKWSGLRAKLLLPLVKASERVSCGFANRLITTSSGFQEKLLARGIPEKKLTLVLNAADSNVFFRPGTGRMARESREGQILMSPRLVYHGTVAHRFGIHVLIEAVSMLKNRGFSPELRVHGKYDADYRLVLDQLITERGLAQSVTLGGYLTHEEIREMLYDMDIGVVPYLRDSFMDLALSTKSFEYVAVGLPVVASRVASMTALFTDGSLLYFTAGDATDLAAGIEKACIEPEIRRSLVAQADREYAALAWPVQEARYVGLVESLLGAN